jgi:hypothetical protein
MTFTQVTRDRRYWRARQSQIAYSKEDKGLFKCIFGVGNALVAIGGHRIIFPLVDLEVTRIDTIVSS